MVALFLDLVLAPHTLHVHDTTRDTQCYIVKHSDIFIYLVIYVCIEACSIYTYICSCILVFMVHGAGCVLHKIVKQ